MNRDENHAPMVHAPYTLELTRKEVVEWITIAENLPAYAYEKVPELTWGDWERLIEKLKRLLAEGESR